MASLHIRPALFGGILAGAVCFGIGMAVLGYCPGTSVAACGEGRRDAMVGVLGMFAGAVAFIAAFPVLQPIINGLGDGGKLTLPQLTGTSPWLWVAGLVAGGVLALIISRFKSHRLKGAARCSTAKRYERVRTSVDGRWHGQAEGGEEVAGSV